MTYSLNGVPLDHTGYGWSMMSDSKPIADLAVQLDSVRVQGRHGVVSPLVGVLDAPVLRIVVRMSRTGLRTFEAFARAGGVLTSIYDPGEIPVEFASLSVTGYGSAEETVDVAVAFRVPGALARGAAVTSTVVVLGAASVTVPSLFLGLSAEVQDAVVRVKGAVTGLQVTDAGGGSWFAYSGSLSGSQWLRFDSGTGRAFVTSTDTWTGGTEVSGDIDFGGPRGVFEIAPRWTSNPATRAGQLTVATASRSGAEVQVRGRSAHLV